MDERLDKLAERHDALTPSVELLVAGSRQQADSIQRSSDSIERTGKLRAQVVENIRALD